MRIVWEVRPLRGPHKLSNGLMHCEHCECTYSRGGWVKGRYIAERNSTQMSDFLASRVIPDDECPMCGTKEEEEHEQR